MGKHRDNDIEDSKNEKYAIKIKGMKMTDRSCTDMLCCLVFIIFFATCVGITGLGIKQGDPRRIMTPFDSDGNECGQPNQQASTLDGKPWVRDFTDYPYKYFTKVADEAL